MTGSRTKNTSRDPRRSWTSALRSPWTVACAAAVVVLGPSAVTASALDRANAAPLHGASAPEHPAPGQERGRHARPSTDGQYAYVPRAGNRGSRP
ncbi:hypothetical protein [Streptomyces sp. VNUA24]|uniref:hypothetical protein n=1 Tax=Streptomyces sp. VNUA24 TaxID=3031131 RepID=UPI0023B83B23|nr:hypothetical protein [Streptomyces sp. VNUA24]WEH18635.1 hypothetical protein PYR72_35150 [Streptomyces sp. VNUA24]